MQIFNNTYIQKKIKPYFGELCDIPSIKPNNPIEIKKANIIWSFMNSSFELYHRQKWESMKKIISYPINFIISSKIGAKIFIISSCPM